VKVSVSGDQISFFERFGYVELEHFFSKAAVQKLALGVAQEQRSGADFFARDLALSSEMVRRVLFSSSLIKCAFAILRKRPLRYAFDQLLQGPLQSPSLPSCETVCVGPILLSALICIRPSTGGEPISHEKFILNQLPTTEGGVTFISSKTALDFRRDFDGEYILLGYGGAHLFYRVEDKDPYNHLLKRRGYLFNDSLKLSTHPLLLKEVLG
jgi:hypothetical protein